MKKSLSLVALLLVLVCAMASCEIINKVFAKEYTVSFDLNGGAAPEGFSENVTVKEGETVALPAPTRENHDFLGWYLDGEVFADDTPITSDITLKAEWKQNNVYTITYNTSGKVEVTSAVYVKGETPKIPETPIVDGYVFFGWYLDEEMTERYFFDYAFGEDITLYAKFYDTTLGEYIVISNVDQLMAIKDLPDAKYLLACDINCKGNTLIPIDEFSGELEGNGYKIFNFTIEEDADCVGFIRINNGTIKNISFVDFIFDVLRSNGNSKYYGVVSGLNYGTIENCHTADGEMKINNTYGEGTRYAYIGGIVGSNANEGSFATVTKCTNNANINMSLTVSGYYIGAISGSRSSSAYPRIAGICGQNLNGTVSDCTNYADILITSTPKSYGYIYISAGGVVGYSEAGVIEGSYNIGTLSVNQVDSGLNRAYVGGVIGESINTTIQNCYTKCDIVIDNIGSSGADNRVGGFAGYSSGKIHNCYSVVDIKYTSPRGTAIGGFIGQNNLVSGHSSIINKCFALGSVELSSIPTNVGYFAGLSNATEKDCYYLDTTTINVITITEVTEGETTETVETVEPVTPTCTAGEAKTFDELASVNFIENTLYFDRMVWLVVEAQLPTLR